jgi:hypothetical protein
MTNSSKNTWTLTKSVRHTETTVKGGFIKREADTGKLTEVRTINGSYKPKPLSEATLSQTISKRSDALKRLANR